MSKLRITYSFATQILELESALAELEFLFLRTTNEESRQRIQKKMSKIKNDIKFHQEQIDKGWGLKPRWFG